MNAKLHLVPLERPEDDGVLSSMRRHPLLDCKEVDAVCTRIKNQRYRAWGQTKCCFIFEVAFPEKHSGTELEMFVRYKTDWKKAGPPRASKLWKLLPVIGSTALHPMTGLIVEEQIVGKMYRCKLHVTKDKDTGAAYSVIRILSERLTG